jgi:uncharacterized cupin superfamily protein
MSDYTAKRISDMQASYGGGFVKVRAELGLSSFGAQVIQLPPNEDRYPLHDHAEDGQEELFVVLSGSGWMEVEGDKIDLDTETMVRVAPEPKRQVFAGPDGLRMLVVGGIPGKAFEIKPVTELTAS